ncbi:prephenate dehydrogenase [Defluviitalea phaphyphila]|uniref:prephenate dehydrogenase n=1 Tax=Defluviitalea phaphyphila TaxID=1473580 RepID=UPI0007311685|nr:prephenate dehydrogenase [Defluviitalea phaphyphila]
MEINKVGIIGLGLIGGSLARALRIKSRIKNIVALDIDEKSLKQAFDDGIITNFTTSVDETFSNCDIIFICTPVKKISNYVKELLPFINKECIITDVGSTKNDVVNTLNTYLNEKNIYFIGGHPMTGSEKTGYKASKVYLFENAYYILTPQPETPKNILKKLKELISSLGAIPVILSPEYHDLVTASISHVPHIIASALVNMVKSLDDEDKYMHKLAAGGFKDITRIASSSPEMWHNVCITNQEQILFVLDKFINILTEISYHIKNKDDDYIWKFFDDAKRYRDTFSNRNPGPFIKTYEIIVDILDKPGSIANIATLLSNNDINIKNIGIINNREDGRGVLQIIFDTEEDQKKSIKLLRSMNYNIHVN